MSAVHSFNIPDVANLVDLEGLLEVLLSKVVACQCLFGCSRKVYDSPQAAQQHMIDANHCRVLYDDEHAEEYEDFYDYTERDSSGRALVVAAPCALEEAVVLDSGDLALPTGGVAVHRSLVRYYKQNFRLGERPAVDTVQRFGVGALPSSVRLAERRGLRPSGPAVGGGVRSSKQGVRGQKREVGYWKNLYEKTGIRNNKIHVWERGPGGAEIFKRTYGFAHFSLSLPLCAMQLALCNVSVVTTIWVVPEPLRRLQDA